MQQTATTCANKQIFFIYFYVELCINIETIVLSMCITFGQNWNENNIKQNVNFTIENYENVALRLPHAV